jgi:C4-dicarboxylate-specific signal transduction histidine kinase
MAILATAGQFVYIYLQKRAEAILLRGQRRYQETLKQAARELARIHNLKKLSNLITHIVTRTVGIRHSAMYLYEASKDAFVLKSVRNLKNQLPLVEKRGSLDHWFENHREPLVREEIESKNSEDFGKVPKEELAKHMLSLNATVIVPGFLKDKLLGFLILGQKRSGRIYTSEDLNTFSVLASQAVLAVENAILYENIEEQVRQRTEEIIKLQNQLIQAEKLATMGTLAGGVAHEINNPLAAILTSVQMLRAMGDALDSDTKESLELIEQATQRCRTIVQKLMAYARRPQEASQMSKISLQRVIERAVFLVDYQLQQENVKITLNRSLKQGDGRKTGDFLVMGNQNELEQVITNIILNAKDAIKQIKKGGNIRISLLENGSGWLQIDIQDDGAGMPAETLAKIFDPFFTTKDVGRGMGLGLSICQAIIERHNGLISVQSELNKGSVFTIKLPRMGPQPEAGNPLELCSETEGSPVDKSRDFFSV